MEKRETDFNKIYESVKKELKLYKKKWFIDAVIDADGSNGIIYQALESMAYSGKYKYPTTYKYRKELSAHYKKYIKERSKLWEAKQ